MQHNVDLLRLSLHSEIHLHSVSRMACLTSKEISGKHILRGWLLATSAKGLPTIFFTEGIDLVFVSKKGLFI